MKLIDYRRIAPGLNAEIAAVFAKHNLKIKKQSATVDERGGAVFLRIEVLDTEHKDESGAATNPDRESYKRLCSLYDLKPEWLDQVFSYGRESYRVAGLNPKKKNNVVLIERLSDHSMRIAPAAMVVGAFAAAERKAS